MATPSNNKKILKNLKKYKLTYNSIDPATSRIHNFKCITFFGNVSFQLANVLKKFQISICFKKTNTMCKLLINTKDKAEKISRSAVYSLEYGACSVIYVRQSVRKIAVRFGRYGDQIGFRKAPHNICSLCLITLTLHECTKAKKLDLIEKMVITMAT